MAGIRNSRILTVHPPQCYGRRVVRQVLRTIPLLVAICLVSFPAYAKYGGGTGEPNYPYLIYTAEQMNAIGAEPNDWDKHFKLMADIDLSAYTGTDYNIIGYYKSTEKKAFTGVFDGNGHTISSFSYTSTSRSHTGLFGYIDDPNTEIKDLGLIDPNIDAGLSFKVGSLVGYMIGGTITGCYVGDGSIKGYWYIGGLVGSNLGGFIIRCYSISSVSGHNDVGGLIGENFHGSVIKCYSTGSVDGDNWVGGLVGSAHGSMIHCFSTSSVNGDYNVGGLVGFNGSHIIQCYSTGSVSGVYGIGGLVGGNRGPVIQCYSRGAVTGERSIGGLVGGMGYGGHVFDCFWDIQTSGQATSDGGAGLTTAQMQDIKTYLDAGWDLVSEMDDGTSQIWQIPQEGGYPVLAIFNGYIPPILQGLGTPEDPYLISDKLELGAIAHYSPYAHYQLADSIDLSGIRWGIAVIPWFEGTFDGNSLAISHLTIKGEGYLGLFGLLDSRAEVKDLGVVDVNISGLDDHIGGLVGYNSWLADVNQCYSTGSVSGDYGIGGLVGNNESSVTHCKSNCTVNGRIFIGGLVGDNWDGYMEHCNSTGTVSGVDYIGGLVGGNGGYGTMTKCYSSGMVIGSECIGGLVGGNVNWQGTLSQCYSSCTVRGNLDVGGLVGKNGDCFSAPDSLEGYVCMAGIITNCYSTGSVSGQDNVGGLVGRSLGHVRYFQPTLSAILNCYSAGFVSGDSNVGGLVGFNEEGSVISSLWDIQTSGRSNMCGTQGLEANGCNDTNAKTTAEMQTASTFLDAGWDFVGEAENGIEDIWWILEGQDYPRLWWEAAEP